MYEAQKLKEARYFLGEMNAKVRDRNAFIHCLSAFLSASRSVAQYALKEAQKKPNGQAWYDGEVQVAKRPQMSLFKDERDINIHTKPVGPKAVFEVELHVTLHLRGSADYRVRFLDEKGQPVEIVSPPPEPAPPPPPIPPAKEPEVRYEFADRPGDDLLVLCEQYLKELMSLVQSGQAAGFLSP